MSACTGRRECLRPCLCLQKQASLEVSACGLTARLLACARKNLEMRLARQPVPFSRRPAGRLQDSVEMPGLACKPAAWRILLADFLKTSITAIFGKQLQLVISPRTARLRTCPECVSINRFPR